MSYQPFKEGTKKQERIGFCGAFGSVMKEVCEHKGPASKEAIWPIFGVVIACGAGLGIYLAENCGKSNNPASPMTEMTYIPPPQRQVM